jgi:hypothetical protein
VTVEVFIASLLSTLTCFGPYRPSSEGTSILLDSTITLGVLIAELPSQERQAAQDWPRHEKQKTKGHEPVGLKNFNLNNKKFLKTLIHQGQLL